MLKNHPHIIIDNEKQLQLLRGKIGMLNMYPAANKTFAKLLSQIFKLANERSPIQSFDSKDLEKCFSTNGRILVGSTIARNANISDLGSKLYQGCLSASPCPGPSRNISTGVLILITTSEMASDAEISNKMEAAFSYVGGRTKTMFFWSLYKRRHTRPGGVNAVGRYGLVSFHYSMIFLIKFF